MKFTCEQCDAQYMISDEKVGPNGVKVRCKKCSNVILVRRAVENGAAAPEAPAKPAASAGTGEHALDAELGHAFDNAFGENQAKGTPAPEPGADVDGGKEATREEAGRPEARPEPSEPSPAEWYVAIGQAQVGPLPLAEVRRKWEGGDVGPDSLVWRPGMGDWSPLSSVADLAAYLAPVARPRPVEPAPPAPVIARTFGGAGVAAAPARAPSPAAEVSWKPVGASALAALASEEIAAHGAPEHKSDSNGAVPSGARSLVDALPEGGGVDPTGALPLPIKALEKTGEQKIERRSSVARGAAELRHRRSSSRTALIGAAAVVVLLGGGAAAGYLFLSRSGPATPVVATEPPAAASPGRLAAPAGPREGAPAVVAATPPPAAAPAAEPSEPQKAPEPARAEPAPKGPQTRVARAEPPARTKREPPARAPARASARAEEQEPEARPPARKKGGSILDFESNDAALEEALGNKGSGRSVYVPAPPGGGALVAKVSDSQVNETILGRVTPLQQCVSEQKSRDPEASGVLRMRWSIAPDGSVQNVKCLTSEYASSPFAKCLTGVLRGTRFPRSAQGRQEVTFPIKF
jgi:predicted Zn finger-like uncharacterized protein